MKKIIAGLALVLAGVSANAQEYVNRAIQVGKPAPALEFPNPDGQVQNLADIAKGRVVLLDFWASWCGPCRRASPEVVALYNKYKDAKFASAKNGFTIVSVSLDKDKNAWMAAIMQDNLSWPYHMSDLGGWTSKGAQTYGVEFIPQSFLIGPDGNVIEKYTMENFAQLDAKLGQMTKKKG